MKQMDPYEVMQAIAEGDYNLGVTNEVQLFARHDDMTWDAQRLATQALASRPAREAAIAELVAAAKAVDRDAAGRSGGAVYMIHKDKFLALRAALAAMEASDATE
jgi:hypothetical protein